MSEPLTHCPMCNQPVPNYFEIAASKPFTAYNPMQGLTTWGAYSAPKETLCYSGGQYIHFKLGEDERLVKMIEVTG